MTGRSCAFILLAALWSPLAAHAADGTWAVNASGNWSDTTKWTGGIVANGTDSTAYFTKDGNGNSVTISTNRTIGNMTFSCNQSGCFWDLGGGGVLTLATSSGTPTINVLSGPAFISSVLTGNSGLHKTGPTQLILSVPNTYTGTTTISGGLLQIGFDASLGNPSNGITLDGGTFNAPSNYSCTRNITLTTAVGSAIYNSGGTSILSGMISGSGGITFTGGSAVVLTGNNTYQGDTTIDIAVLRAIEGAGLPIASNLMLKNGTFQTSGTFTRGLGTGSGQVRWSASGGFSAFGGPLTVQIGGNTDTLTWSSPNFVSGALVLNAFNSDSLVNFQNGIDLAGGARTISVANNSASSADLAQISGPISNGDLTKSNVGTLILAGNNSYNNTILNTVGGTLQIGNGGATGTLGSGSVTFAGGANANTLAFNRSNDYTFSGAITSAATNNSIVQTGAGTTTLTGTMSAYNGSFSVSAGKLLINTTVGGTGAVTVESGGTFGGNGTMGGAVTVKTGGAIAPGTSIKTLGVGSLTLATGSILDFELDTILGVDHSDLIHVSTANGLTINGGTLNLANTGRMTDGTYTLIDYAGYLNGSVSNITLGTAPAAFNFILSNNAANTSIDLVVASTGDFNQDGSVDAADYVVWRKGLGTTFMPDDLNIWRSHYGETPFGNGSSHSAVLATVPEPTALLLMVMEISLCVFKSARKDRESLSRA